MARRGAAGAVRVPYADVLSALWHHGSGVDLSAGNVVSWTSREHDGGGPYVATKSGAANIVPQSTGLRLVANASMRADGLGSDATGDAVTIVADLTSNEYPGGSTQNVVLLRRGDTDNEYLGIRYASGDTRIQGTYGIGGVAGTGPIGQNHREGCVAFWHANVSNGMRIYSDRVLPTPVGASGDTTTQSTNVNGNFGYDIQIGLATASGGRFDVRSVAVFKRALTDAECNEVFSYLRGLA